MEVNQRSLRLLFVDACRVLVGISSFSMRLWVVIATGAVCYSNEWSTTWWIRVRCDVCGTRVPMCARTQHCNDHDYNICEYCLGYPTLPPVGAKVVRGPTWPEEWDVQGDDFDEGIVETELLQRSSLSQSRGSNDGRLEIEEELGMGYHSYFRIRWVTSGRVSNCRGPPFQDVMLAYDNGLAVNCIQAFAFFTKLSWVGPHSEQVNSSAMFRNAKMMIKNQHQARKGVGCVGGLMRLHVNWSHRPALDCCCV